MSFLALEFDANAADAERWADALLDAGALAVDTADPHEGSEREIARYPRKRLPRTQRQPSPTMPSA